MFSFSYVLSCVAAIGFCCVAPFSVQNFIVHCGNVPAELEEIFFENFFAAEEPLRKRRAHKRISVALCAFSVALCHFKNSTMKKD